MDDDDQQQQEQDTYVAQLHQVFAGCDSLGTGYLGRSELTELCSQLHLDDQANLITEHLLGDDPDAKVDFDEFKDKFVFLLSHSVDSDPQEQSDEEDHKSIHLSSPEREVSPKYVWGSKKYGRRSRPDLDSNDTDNDFLSDFSDSEVFISNVPSCNSEETLDVVAANPVRTRVQSSTQTHQGAKRRRRMQSSEEKILLSVESTQLSDAVDGGEGENAGHGRESPVGTSGSENEEDYLKSIWLKLGVGSDGFLNQEGLTRVCEHIGMEKMSEEVISQLFEKLDVDQDGKISFDEFLHLFRNGETASTGSSTASTTVIDANQNSARNIPQQSHSTKDHQMTGVPNAISESGIFSSVDLENRGYVEAETVIELWETLGISGGYRIFKELGFSTSCAVCLVDLTNCLEDHLQNSADSDFAQVAFATYQHELKFLRKSIDQMIIERDKLRGDVADANTRASLLAQEVDDHHAKLEKSSQAKIMNLEKKYQEQSRRLQDELDHEREQLNVQMSSIKQNLEEELASLRDAEARVREQLILLQKENQNMDQEIRELTHKLSEAQKINQQQQLEAESMLALKQEFAHEEQCKAIADELEALRVENKQLKDQNDEKNAEVESLKQQLIAKMNVGNSGCSCTGNLTGDVGMEDDRREETGFGTEEGKGSLTTSEQCHHHRRNGSWLSDYIKVPSIKRRGSGSPLNTSSAEDMSEEDNAFKTVKQKHKLSGSLSCGVSRLEGTDAITLLINDSNSQTPSTMENNEKPQVESVVFDIHDWSDDEYLQLRHPQNSSLTTDLHCQQHNFQCHNRSEIEEAIKKLEIKKVFTILKQRFIEEHLQEVEHKKNSTFENCGKEDVGNKNRNLMLSDSKNVFLEGADKRINVTGIGFTANIEQDHGPSGNADVEGTHLPLKDYFIKAGNTNFDFEDERVICHLPSKSNVQDTALENFQNEEVEVKKDNISMDNRKNQLSMKRNQECKKRNLIRQSHVETNEMYEEQVNSINYWKKLLEAERVKWKTLIQTLENDNEALQNKLVSKEISHKKDMLKSEVFWRGQVEQERQELEEDKAHLQDQILGLEYQLESSTLQKFGPGVNATHFFDLQASDTEEDLNEKNTELLATAGYKAEQTKGAHLTRSRSWRENVVCGQRVASPRRTWKALDAKRKAWIKSRNNLEALAIEIDSYDNLEDGSDSEYDDEDSDPMTEHNHSANCLQRQFNRIRQKRRKQRDPIERDLGKLQNVAQGSSPISSRDGQERRFHQSTVNNESRSTCVIDVGMLISINQHMKQQENRCRQLEASLKAKALQTERALKEIKHGYDEEMKRVSHLLQKTKTLLKEETNKVKEKNEKLLQADILVKELYLENAHLMKNLQFLEEKTHKTEKSNLTLQQKCQALNQLLTEMCRNPTSP